MQKFSRWRAFIPLTKFSSLNLFYQVLPFFLLVGLFSCTNGKPGHMNLQNLHIGVTLTPIRKIKPAQDNQTTVYIQGKIQKHAPLLNQQAYQITDATGQIWVVTNQNNFRVGQEVVLKGKVKYKSIPLASQEFGEVYLEEQ